MKKVIEQLIAACQNAGLDNSPEELADIIWYASNVSDFEISKVSSPSSPEPVDNSSLTVIPDSERDEESKESQSKANQDPETEKPQTTEEQNSGADLYSADSGGSGASTLPFRTPGGRALPNALRLSRALRPLVKRIPSPTQFVLDENASANQIAQTKIWLPVIKNAPMRWFDLVLVIENSPSMLLWQQTTKELRQLFAHLGAFRDIRVWRLETHSDDQHFDLYTEGSKSPHSYKELIEPALPRLIVIATDCLSPAWKNAEFLRCLDTWGNEHPVSIIQMLPQRLWPQTGLRNTRLVKVSATSIAKANCSLQYRQPSLKWQTQQAGGKFPIPLMTLEPETLANWAKFITGSGSVDPLPAFIFNAPSQQLAVENPHFNPKDTLARFKSVASPTAFRLACYLAAVPLRLPIMRLVQRVQLPESEQTHLAEFFLSGLIKRLSAFDISETDEIEYEFVDGIRQSLLALTPVSYVLNAQEVVSEYINEQYGTAIDFHALINITANGGEYAVPGQTPSELGSAFARVSSQVLNLIGIQSMFTATVSGNQESSPRSKITESIDKASSIKSAIAPQERVNITYQAHIDGDIREVELPNKILVIGDFSLNRENEEIFYRDRNAINIDQGNFNNVMASYNLTIQLVIEPPASEDAEEGEEIQVHLGIKNLNDLTPDRLVKMVPHLSNLLEKGNALRHLKAQMHHHPQFKQQLLVILNNKKIRLRLQLELGIDAESLQTQPANETSIIDQLLELAHVREYDNSYESELDCSYESVLDGFRLLLIQLLTSESKFKHSSSLGVDDLIAETDEKLGFQLDHIMHYETFQKMESAWRGLKFLVDRTDFKQNNKISVLDVSKQTLLNEFSSSSTTTESYLYKVLYLNEYGSFGGEPYSTVIANYEFNNSTSDISLIEYLMTVGALAHAPVIASASPEMFGLASADQLAMLSNVSALFEGPQYSKWRALRESDDARYVALTFPRFLLRLPYGKDNNSTKSFDYNEMAGEDNSRYCWGNAAFALASRITNSFAKNRMCNDIVGRSSGGRIQGLPIQKYVSKEQIEIIVPTETMLSDQREFELAEAGFVPIVFEQGSDDAVFFSANSIQKPKNFGITKEGKEAETNYTLGTQLPYIYFINRFAHYIKVVHRENIGSSKERLDIQDELNMWILKYVADQDGVSTDVRARCPLRNALITVEDVEDESGFYKFGMQLRPHFKYMGADFTLSEIGILDN